MTERGTPGCVLKVGFHFAVCTGIRFSVWVLAEERSANAPGSPLDTNASWESPSSVLGFVGFFRVLAFRDHSAHCECVPSALGVCRCVRVRHLAFQDVVCSFGCIHVVVVASWYRSGTPLVGSMPPEFT